MNKFKVGDEVVIVRHKIDSDENYDIGDVDVIIHVVDGDDEDQPYCLKGEGTPYGSWWISASCLEFNNLNLENE